MLLRNQSQVSVGVNTESLSRGNNDSTLSFDDKLLRTLRNWLISTSSSAGDDSTRETLNLELDGDGKLSCTLLTWKRLPRRPGLELGDGIGEGIGDFIRFPPRHVSTETGGGVKLGSQLRDTFRDVMLDVLLSSSSAVCLFIRHIAFIFRTVSLYAWGSC